MIIKEKEYPTNAIRQLEEIIGLYHVPERVKVRAKKELRALKRGWQGERDAAYFINFYFGDSRNWAIIHDLRIEYSGLTAQIDHLMIGRTLEIYVLESKNFSQSIKITEKGEFLVWYNNRYIPIESPIEQNQRHVFLLKKLLKGEDLLPKRLGVPLQPTFRPYVLISPKVRVIRPPRKKFDTSEVIKMDMFAKRVRADADETNPIAAVGFIAKLISVQTLKDFAVALLQYHKPLEIDYYKKLGVARRLVQVQKPRVEAQKSQGGYFCAKCGKPVSKKVAMFCLQHKERFGGKIYCFDCQKTISPSNKKKYKPSN